MEHTGRSELLKSLDARMPFFADEADAGEAFPAASLAELRRLGVMAAPLPLSHGGLGLGCGTDDDDVALFFRLLGRASIALGRLVEAHVNALRLVWRYGDDELRDAASRAVHDGALFGLWVTDGAAPLALIETGGGGTLAGGKAFCSGAGHVTHALVTARRGDEPPELRLITLDTQHRRGTARTMLGVRGAVTADMRLDGLDAGWRVGAPGDYLRQPEFSAGAWRGSAIAAGGLDALVAVTIETLVRRDRHRNPHQAERIGRALIARDTASFWVGRAVEAAGGARPADEIAATVNLARIAVETASLEAIGIVQRALGLSGLLAGSRVERLLRDLMTYLRQPAPDETLTEAAIWFAEQRRAP